MVTVPETPLTIPPGNASTTRTTRARLAGNLGVLVYFVVLVCLSQVEVIFGVHSGSASVFFGHFTYHGTPRWSPLIDDAEGFVRQSLDYLGVGLITHGHSPWWNPYSGLGSPLAQDWSAGIFYPVSFVVEWLHLDSTGIDVTALTDMVIAGVCAYWLGRVLGLRRTAALVAGTAFCLGGSVVWGGSLFANVIAWTPASLALTVRLLGPRGPRRRDVVLLAGVTGIQVLGGYPELFVLQFLLLTLPLGLASLLRLRKGRIRGALGVIEGVGVGVAVTAFLWVPFASVLPSEMVWNRAGEGVRHVAAWVDLVFLAPFAFGRFYNHPLSLTDWFTVGGYVGGMAAWLALAATFGWRRRPWVVVPFAISAVMAIMLINGVAPLAWVGKMPGLTVVPLARLSFMSLALAVAVLAAVAVDRSPSLAAWVAATAVVGGSLLYLVAAAPSPPMWRAVLFPALCILAVGMLWFAIRQGPRIFRARFPSNFPEWASSAMVLGVVAVELLVISNVNWDISTPAAPAFGAPQWVNYVRSHLGDGRLYTASPLLYPSYAGDFGIRSLSFQDAVAPKRTVAFYTKEIGKTLIPFGFIGLNYKNTLADHLQGLELAGVTMLALPYPECAPACDDLHLLDVDRAGSVGVFAVPSPQPMVWLPAAAVTGTGVPTSPLYSAAVPAGSGVATGAQGPAGGLGMTGDNARIVVHVDTSDARLLVLRQVDFPGWTANIDGRSARIVLVDGVFDGVVVPPGESMVVFSYLPPGLPLGEVISLVALLWVGAGALVVVWKRRKRHLHVRANHGPTRRQPSHESCATKDSLAEAVVSTGG
jgi:hypothetical protein